MGGELDAAAFVGGLADHGHDFENVFGLGVVAASLAAVCDGLRHIGETEGTAVLFVIEAVDSDFGPLAVLEELYGTAEAVRVRYGESTFGTVDIDAAAVCVPASAAASITDRLAACGIKAFWNFTNHDILAGHPNAFVENVHLSDSLMSLCYKLNDASIEE